MKDLHRELRELERKRRFAREAAGAAAPLVTALLLAWPAAAAEPEPTPTSAPPDPELLEFLGESAGVDTELAQFMETREAKRAMKDAAKESRKQEDHE